MHTILRRGAVGLSMFALVALLALSTQVRDTQAGLATYLSDDTAPIAWMDIAGTGTLLTGISDDDDEYQSDVPIGFTFNFAGTDYTVLEPTSNGVISLDQENNDEYDNNDYGPLPTSEWSGAALFPWWDDLDTSIDGSIYAETLGTAPNRAFVIQYDGISHQDSSPAGFGSTFQTVLCEGSNNIVFQYLDAVFGDPSYPENDNGGDATVGIQESDTSALQYSHLSPVIVNDIAIVFYPVGGSPTNCLGGPAPTATAIAPTDTPAAPAPTDTPGLAGTAVPTATVAAIALPDTGASATPGGTATSHWLIALLASAAVAGGLGFAAARLRAKRI